jgi:hypothetical protein
MKNCYNFPGSPVERAAGYPGFFYQKIIEIFITVNGQGQFLPEGPGGGKGEPGVPPIIFELFYVANKYIYEI